MLNKSEQPEHTIPRKTLEIMPPGLRGFFLTEQLNGQPSDPSSRAERKER
jgi:hypothetical protein